MADNVVANPGVGGATFATDDDGVAQHPYTKLEWGPDNTFTKVDVGAGAIPIQDGGNTITVDGTVATTDGGGSLTVDNTVLSVVGGGVEATAQRVTIASDSTGVLSVDDNGGSLTVDGTVTVQDGGGAISVDDNGSTISIDDGAGNISIDDGGNTITVDWAASTATIEVVGDIAHDTGVGGNPVQIAGAAQDMDDTAPPNRVSAESDTTRFATDRDGGLFVHPHGPQLWSQHLDGSTAYTDQTVHSAPGAGLSLYVTDIIFSTGSATACNIFFEEGSTKVLGPWYLEAVAGRGLALHFQTPKKITANTALTVTTSASIAQSIDVMGYVAAG